MVKNRHEIVPVVFRNQARPRSEIEVLRLSKILRRAGPGGMEQVQRMEFHTVALFLSGRSRHTIDFVPHKCRPGTVIHALPGQVQRWDITPGLEALVVIFTPAFLLGGRSKREAAWSLEHLSPGIDLSGDDQAAILGWFQRLEELYRALDDTAVSAALLRHLVWVLLLDLFRRGGEELSPEVPDRIDARRLRTFKQDVERSYRVTRRVLDYAERLACSAKTLDRTCHEALGISAKEYIDGRVVLEAKRLLAHTNQTVAAISEELGFSEPTNFVKFFRSRGGLLPGAFRERLGSA